MDNGGYVDVTSIGDSEINEVEDRKQPKMNKRIIMDKIRDDRLNHHTGEREYLIKWKSVKESWERAVEVEVFDEFVQLYKTRKGKAPKYIGEEEQEEDVESLNDESVDNNFDNRRHSERKRVPTNKFVQQSSNKKLRRKSSARKSGAFKDMSGMEDSDEGSEYKVEKILDRRITKKGERFLIKWKGFGPEWNSWEPKKGLAHLDIFKKYQEQINKKENNEEDESDSDKEYVAEKVLDRRVGKDGELEYHIKWEGYGDTRNSWEPRSGIGHLKTIKDYDALNPITPKSTDNKTRSGKRKIQDSVGTPSSSNAKGPSKKSGKRRRRY